MKLFIKIVAALLCVFVTNSLFAAMYKSIDSQGKVTYSQAPPKSGNYKTIKAQKFKPVPANASKKSIDAKKLFKQGTQQRNEDNLIKAELTKNRKIQQENCNRAKKNLRIYTLYRKLKDDKGEYYRVSDTEKAQGINTAKGNIKQFCK